MVHVVANDVDVGLPLQFGLQGVERRVPLLSDEHSGQDRVEKAAMPTDQHGVGFDEVAVGLVFPPEFDGADPGDDGHEGRRPRRHDPPKPSLRPGAVDTETEWRTEPGEDHQNEPGEVCEDQPSDQHDGATSAKSWRSGGQVDDQSHDERDRRDHGDEGRGNQ